MFLSTRRPILFPQSEHLKLAGTLAFAWGSPQFEMPPLPAQSVITGIALHDRAYGYLDDFPVPSSDTPGWLELTRRGFYMPCADAVADLITKVHLLRLVAKGDTPGHTALAGEMRSEITRLASQHGLDLALLQQVDRLTNLCDRISFDFCREKSTEGRVEVVAQYASGETRAVHYWIEGKDITLDPWPLRPPQVSGYIIGYAQENYPHKPDALIAPYHIHPA